MLFITKVAVGSDFSGQWCWDKDSKMRAFSLVIDKVSGVYKGGYYSVALGGNIIDDNETAFSFKVTDKNIVETKLTAGIDGSTGLIRLISDSKRLEWILLRKPKGEIFVPDNAILHRCK